MKRLGLLVAILCAFPSVAHAVTIDFDSDASLSGPGDLLVGGTAATPGAGAHGGGGAGSRPLVTLTYQVYGPGAAQPNNSGTCLVQTNPPQLGAQFIVVITHPDGTVDQSFPCVPFDANGVAQP